MWYNWQLLPRKHTSESQTHVHWTLSTYSSLKSCNWFQKSHQIKEENIMVERNRVKLSIFPHSNTKESMCNGQDQKPSYLTWEKRARHEQNAQNVHLTISKPKQKIMLWQNVDMHWFVLIFVRLTWSFTLIFGPSLILSDTCQSIVM